MAIAGHKKIIAVVLGAAITVASIGASPAVADQRNGQQLLGALLGLAVIGAVIADRSRDAPEAVQPVTRARPQALTPRPLPERVRRQDLPAQCLREVRRPNGRTARMFGARCLQNNYHAVGRLPQACQRQFRAGHGNRIRNGWSATCLRQNGYRVAVR